MAFEATVWRRQLGDQVTALGSCEQLSTDIEQTSHGLAGGEPLALESHLCFVLLSAARRVQQRYQAALGQLRITHTQYLVLIVLWTWDREHRPEPTARALGQLLALDSSTLTPLLRRLETRCLVERTVAQRDRRERHIHLTEAGRALRIPAQQLLVSLLAQGPVPAAEILALCDRVNRFRMALSAAPQP